MVPLRCAIPRAPRFSRGLLTHPARQALPWSVLCRPFLAQPSPHPRRYLNSPRIPRTRLVTPPASARGAPSLPWSVIPPFSAPLPFPPTPLRAPWERGAPHSALPRATAAQPPEIPPSAHRVPSALSVACADASPTAPRSAWRPPSQPSLHALRPKDTEERGLQVPVAALRSSVAPLRNRHFKAASPHHAPRATYGGPAGLHTLRASQAHHSAVPFTVPAPAARPTPCSAPQDPGAASNARSSCARPLRRTLWRPPRRLPALSLVEGRRRGAARSTPDRSRPPAQPDHGRHADVPSANWL